MTNDGFYDEDSDPLLVRPFLFGDGDRDDSSEHTWPSTLTHEVRSHRVRRDTDATTVTLFRQQAPERPDRHRLFVVAAAGAAVLVGAATAGLAVLRPDDERPPVNALHDPPPLATNDPPSGRPSSLLATPASRAATTGRRAPSTTAVPDGNGAPAPAPTTAPGAASETDTVVINPGSGTTTTIIGATTAPPELAAPSPPSGNTGPIRGQNGLCLDGTHAADGAEVQVAACTGGDAQTWTVAGDGTIRVLDQCALAAGDNTVHLGKCDGRSTAQWRIVGQLLVNVSTAACVTDPFAGARPGTDVKLTFCGGAAAQRWSLP